MKKEYINPNVAALYVVVESMLALSDNRENMGSNETPGGQDDFNAGANVVSGAVCGRMVSKFSLI